MGSSKFHLEKTHRYQVLKAVALFVELLSSAEEERADGPLELAAEVDGAGEWDDVVVYYPTVPGGTEHAHHWQIKRQSTDITKADAVERLKTLFKEAYDLLLADQGNCMPGCEPSRQFNLGFARMSWRAQLSPGSKGLVPISALQELALACKGIGNPQVGIIQSGGNNDEQRSWFSFLSAATGSLVNAALVLRHLHVAELGTEDDLSQASSRVLSQWFENADQVFDALRSQLSEMNNQTRLSPEDLAGTLSGFKRRPGSPQWTSIRPTVDGTGWGIIGTIPPQDIVGQVWAHGPVLREVRLVHAPSRSTASIDTALARLVLHSAVKTSTRVLPPQVRGWHTLIESRTGRTLGLAENDPAAEPLLDPFSAQPRACDPRNAQTIDAAGLHLQQCMDAHTWGIVSERVDKLISELPTTCDLLTVLKQTWFQIKASFGAQGAEAIAQCLARMLRVEIEPPDVDGRIRCGPKTEELLGMALFMALVLSVGQGKSLKLNNGVPGAAFRTESSDVHVVALRKCSVDPDGVVPIEDVAPGLVRKKGIHILSGTGASSSAIVQSVDDDEPWSKATTAPPTFDAPGGAEVVLTNDRAFRIALRTGKAKLEDFIRQRVRESASREKKKTDAAVHVLQAIEADHAA